MCSRLFAHHDAQHLRGKKKKDFYTFSMGNIPEIALIFKASMQTQKCFLHLLLQQPFLKDALEIHMSNGRIMNYEHYFVPNIQNVLFIFQRISSRKTYSTKTSLLIHHHSYGLRREYVMMFEIPLQWYFIWLIQ